jgi:hypothetical protein
VSQALQERPVRTEATGKMVGKALLVWLGLVVPAGILVSRARRVRRERLARLDRLDRLARLARPVSKENRGPLVPQEWMEDPDCPAGMVYLLSKGHLERWDQRDLSDPWDQWDQQAE